MNFFYDWSFIILSCLLLANHLRILSSPRLISLVSVTLTTLLTFDTFEIGFASRVCKLNDASSDILVNSSLDWWATLSLMILFTVLDKFCKLDVLWLNSFLFCCRLSSEVLPLLYLSWLISFSILSRIEPFCLLLSVWPIFLSLSLIFSLLSLLKLVFEFFCVLFVVFFVPFLLVPMLKLNGLSYLKNCIEI